MAYTALRIDNPCPVSLLAMKKDEENYHCKFCRKTVIDFRSKTQNEILEQASSGICGIFYDHQLPGQPKRTLSGRLRLLVLGVISLLGFHLGGRAQAPPDSTKIEQKQFPRKKPVNRSLPVCPKDQQPMTQGKKNGFRTIGCPSF